MRDAQGTLAKSFTYDGAGETISQVKAGGPTLAYTYDARGRMASVSSNGTQLVANLYDHAGRRVSRAQGSGIGALTVHYLFDDAGQLLAEHDGSTGALLREYIWLGGMLVAMVDGPVATPVYTYVHTGHLDEPILTTNAARQVTSSITRDPYGNAIMLSGSAQIALGYPGQWHDQSAGLYQNWNRDYDPSTGRYLETDPIGLVGGTNLYAYTDGNPVNAVDPEGLYCLILASKADEPDRYQRLMRECRRRDDKYELNVFGHGAPDVICKGRGRRDQSECMSPKQFYDQYRKRYPRIRKIVLFACRTGQGENSFAEQTANLWKKSVVAPTNYTWWRYAGMVGIFGKTPEGKLDPNNRAEWKGFSR